MGPPAAYETSLLSGWRIAASRVVWVSASALFSFPGCRGKMNRMLLIPILNGVLYLKGIHADKIKSGAQWGNFTLSRNLK